jgi:hypothetical protein
MQLFGKFLSVITYNAPGAWNNPQLNRLLGELRTRPVSSGDLDSLHSLGVLSIQTTTNTNIGTHCRLSAEELAVSERMNCEKPHLFGEYRRKKLPTHSGKSSRT